MIRGLRGRPGAVRGTADGGAEETLRKAASAVLPPRVSGGWKVEDVEAEGSVAHSLNSHVFKSPCRDFEDWLMD